MKRFILLSVIVSVLINITISAQEQIPASLDQLKLMDQFAGTWEGKTGEGTSQIWEFIKNGNSFYANLYGVKQSVKTRGSTEIDPNCWG